MNCIVIDDSANALELMKIHVSKVPYLKLIGAYQSALEALDAINTQKIDLIFTDIDMPSISGMEFVKSLNTDALVVFTTAYSEYALEGYEVNAIDYLLKPISFEKFLTAANKAQEFYKQRSHVQESKTESSAAHYVLFKSSGEHHRIDLNQILFLESKGNYMKIQLTDNSHIMSLMTMNEALDKLKGGNFFRCHRGFIISLDHIRKISSHEVDLNGHMIPVGKNYRSELQELMGL